LRVSQRGSWTRSLPGTTVEAAPKLVTAAGSPLRVRVGIATGLVVVGDTVGLGEAQERGVVGETPNLASPGNCAWRRAWPGSGATRARNEGRDLLSPVYTWFTEGFDTLDLKEAKLYSTRWRYDEACCRE
jgi:hypothetical protein